MALHGWRPSIIFLSILQEQIFLGAANILKWIHANYTNFTRSERILGDSDGIILEIKIK